MTARCRLWVYKSDGKLGWSPEYEFAELDPTTGNPQGRCVAKEMALAGHGVGIEYKLAGGQTVVLWHPVDKIEPAEPSKNSQPSN